MTVATAVLDIDGNGDTEALSDGLLALRYLFGFQGTALTTGAVGAGCTRCDAGSIEPYLDGLGSVLDVDGNGNLDPLTDGLLILRFLFGFSGDALVNGAVAGNCSRCTADEIGDYLQSLV
jgi:hypothetical protein